MTKPQSPTDPLNLFANLPPAYLSPSTPSILQCLYINHGGQTLNINSAHPLDLPVSYYFITFTDPLIPELSKRPIVLYSVEWIGVCIEAGELVPLGGFIVDPFTTTGIEGKKRKRDMEMEDGDEIIGKKREDGDNMGKKREPMKAKFLVDFTTGERRHFATDTPIDQTPTIPSHHTSPEDNIYPTPPHSSPRALPHSSRKRPYDCKEVVALLHSLHGWSRLEVLGSPEWTVVKFPGIAVAGPGKDNRDDGVMKEVGQVRQVAPALKGEVFKSKGKEKAEQVSLGW